MLRSNKTLIGQAGARLADGGLELYQRQNVIIRNIVFADGTDHTMKINQNTHPIWVESALVAETPFQLLLLTSERAGT